MLINTQEFKNAILNASLSTTKDRDNILHNILIEQKGRIMEIRAQSNTTKLINRIETEEEQEFSFALDPQKLINILKEVKEDKIELEPEEKTITIKSGSFKTTIKMQSSQLFPQFEEKDKIELCEVEAEKIKKLIKQTIYCPDKNDIAREYTGVYIEIGEDSIKATATDHYRLINVKSELKAVEPKEFILENSGANLINRVPLQGNLKLYYSDDEITLKGENIEVSSKLIKGTFPDYNQILLNRETSSVIEVEKDRLKEATKRSSVISENREITVKIDPEKNLITLVGVNSEGEEAQDSLNFKAVDLKSGLVIKLDAKFILDFLNQVDAESVVFIFRTSEEPVMFEAEEEGYSYKYITTPIIE